MKKKIIVAIIILVLIVGFLVLNHYLSNYMFDDTGILRFQSRKEGLMEVRTNINTIIQTEEERIEFINNCLKLEQISKEEADFLLGITDEL